MSERVQTDDEINISFAPRASQPSTLNATTLLPGNQREIIHVPCLR